MVNLAGLTSAGHLENPLSNRVKVRQALQKGRENPYAIGPTTRRTATQPEQLQDKTIQ